MFIYLVTEERFHSNWLFTIHTKLRPVMWNQLLVIQQASEKRQIAKPEPA